MFNQLNRSFKSVKLNAIGLKGSDYSSALLVYLTSGSLYFFSLGSVAWILLLLVFSTGMVIFRGRIAKSANMLIYTSLVSIYFLLHGFIFPLGYQTNIGVVIKVIACFLIISVAKYNFIRAFILVTFWFAIGSLVMYIDLMMVGLLTSITSSFLPELELNDYTRYANHLFLVDMTHSAYGENLFYSGRNSGIFWEPGAYQVILNIALFSHLSNNKTLDIISLVLIFTILTTFSTSGYLILSMTLLLHFGGDRLSLRGVIFGILVAVAIGVFFARGDHGVAKISNIFDLGYLTAGEVVGSQSRVYDTYTDARLFLSEPILGRGSEIPEDVQVSFKGERLGSSNSLTMFFASYGVFGGLIFLFPVFLARMKSFFGPLSLIFWFQMSVEAFILSPIIVSIFMLCLQEGQGVSSSNQRQAYKGVRAE